MLSIQKSRFNLREVVERTIAVLDLIATEKQIEINFHIEPDVSSCFGDTLLLNQVIFKCFENAINHSHPQSVVSLSVTRFCSGHLLFAITDSGTGMEENSPCPLLVQKLVELMDGKVWLENNPGISSKFYFTVRIEEETKSSDDCLSRSLKILLVDDSLDNRNLIVAYLKKFPFEVHLAENGAEALHLMKLNEYDVVLMDIQMPVMDGLTATRIFRDWEKENQKAHLPIAALTAFALKEDYQKSLKAGCDVHITKPVKKVTILETIKDLVSKTA
jgi:CheY-like chemotaxis protein